MQPDSARRQLGQGRAMVFFDLESCYVNWIGETKHDTMSKTIWIIQRLSILFSQKLPNKSQNCIPTKPIFSEIISSNHRLKRDQWKKTLTSCVCVNRYFLLLGRHGAGGPPQTVEGVENESRVRPKLSGTGTCVDKCRIRIPPWRPTKKER